MEIEGKCHKRREDEWSPRIKFATATAKVYLSPPRLGTQSPPQKENYAVITN